jgi:hypothetical protein
VENGVNITYSWMVYICLWSNGGYPGFALAFGKPHEVSGEWLASGKMSNKQNIKNQPLDFLVSLFMNIYIFMYYSYIFSNNYIGVVFRILQFHGF